MKRRWHWIKYGRLVQSCRLYQPNSHLHFPLMATPCNEELNFNRGLCNANMRLSTFPRLTGHVLSCCPHPDRHWKWCSPTEQLLFIPAPNLLSGYSLLYFGVCLSHQKKNANANCSIKNLLLTVLFIKVGFYFRNHAMQTSAWCFGDDGKKRKRKQKRYTYILVW